MECANCKKHIRATENICKYCRKKVNKGFFRKLREFFGTERINEEKFIALLNKKDFPSVTSSREVELYIHHKIHDEEITVIVCEGLERAGNDALFEVKKGGDGNPYKVEYVSNQLPPNMSRKEAEKQIDNLISTLENNSLSKDKKDNIEKDIAQLTKNHVIIWVNSRSEEDFKNKRQLIMDAFAAATEILTGKKSIN